MALPLKLNLSFRNWEKEEGCLLYIFNQIKHIKLFSLELEFDGFSFAQFLRNKNIIPLNTFQKALILHELNSTFELKEVEDFEIVFEIPFKLDLERVKKYAEKISDSVKKPFALSYFLTSDNILQFKYILNFAIKKGIKKLIIPNPDLVNELVFIKNHYLQKKHLNLLVEVKQFTHLISFQVHDYFLAKFLELKDADLFKGCQGGNLVAYIQNGFVYPCKSVPIYLGSLFNENFDTIWKRAEEVMKKNSQHIDCNNCGDKGICKRGCPGTAFFLNNNQKDPLCGK